MKNFKFILKQLTGLLFFLMAGLAFAGPLPNVDGGVGTTGLKLPRFVSIAAGEANMRSGPGEQYPIQWVYNRKLLPLVVIGEFEQWRHVQDADGTLGWMHRVLLSGNRTALVVRDRTTLLDEPSAISPIVARLEAGVVGEIIECSTNWCRLDINGTRGWVPVDSIWGTFKSEDIN